MKDIESPVDKEAERVASFDNCIINADAPSSVNQDWLSISKNKATQKHSKLDKAAEKLRDIFTHLICSAEGILHKWYGMFKKRTEETLSAKRRKPPYSSNRIAEIAEPIFNN